jgi:hypothetical protein
MVDPTLTEQKPIDIERKVNAKSNRRRNNRDRNRRPKENVEPANVAEKPEARTAKPRPSRRRKVNRSAPEVRDDDADAKISRERADYSDGILRLKISNARPRTVYTRLLRLMLAGYDGAGLPLLSVDSIHTVEISALGNAIGSAIYVADNLTRAKVVTQSALSVDFVVVDGERVSPAQNGNFRGAPRLLMTLKRHEGWIAAKDEVLNKTRVYRAKVLGLPEEPRTTA